MRLYKTSIFSCIRNKMGFLVAGGDLSDPDSIPVLNIRRNDGLVYYTDGEVLYALEPIRIRGTGDTDMLIPICQLSNVFEQSDIDEFNEAIARDLGN